MQAKSRVRLGASPLRNSVAERRGGEPVGLPFFLSLTATDELVAASLQAASRELKTPRYLAKQNAKSSVGLSFLKQVQSRGRKLVPGSFEPGSYQLVSRRFFARQKRYFPTVIFAVK